MASLSGVDTRPGVREACPPVNNVFSASRYGDLIFRVVHVIKCDFGLFPVERYDLNSQYCLQHLSRSGYISCFLAAGGINERSG
ncbi:hypothetical protein BON30_11710 [Cystobacter ferrugineus]|uniref:Uncharacterized protein n=1 Tax=Cystobacter ferrugineus TaxID=83449 RepID=A0A1L9BGV9_9BACT|nr:hypothetical protein BON30_11710 [Cystobacter ferrugineus]